MATLDYEAVRCRFQARMDEISRSIGSGPDAPGNCALNDPAQKADLRAEFDWLQLQVDALGRAFEIRSVGV